MRATSRTLYDISNAVGKVMSTTRLCTACLCATTYPESTLVLPEHHPQRAVVPAVDVHNHLGRWHRGRLDGAVGARALVRTMDECNVATIVNLDGMLG